jgi:hypothetical protein
MNENNLKEMDIKNLKNQINFYEKYPLNFSNINKSISIKSLPCFPIISSSFINNLKKKEQFLKINKEKEKIKFTTKNEKEKFNVMLNELNDLKNKEFATWEKKQMSEKKNFFFNMNVVNYLIINETFDINKKKKIIILQKMNNKKMNNKIENGKIILPNESKINEIGLSPKLKSKSHKQQIQQPQHYSINSPKTEISSPKLNEKNENENEIFHRYLPKLPSLKPINSEKRKLENLKKSKKKEFQSFKKEIIKMKEKKKKLIKKLQKNKIKDLKKNNEIKNYNVFTEKVNDFQNELEKKIEKNFDYDDDEDFN